MQFWSQQFLLIFFAKECYFLHKNKLDIIRRVQFHTGRRPMRCFSSEAVATIALWKAAPMILGYSWGCLQAVAYVMGVPLWQTRHM